MRSGVYHIPRAVLQRIETWLFVAKRDNGIELRRSTLGKPAGEKGGGQHDRRRGRQGERIEARYAEQHGLHVSSEHAGSGEADDRTHGGWRERFAEHQQPDAAAISAE